MPDLRRLLLPIALLASPSFAQDAGLLPADRAAMEQCLQSALERGAREHECIGFVQDSCMQGEDGSSTYGQVACIAREQLYWDALLNQSYRTLRESRAEERSTALRDLQRQWLDWRKARCEWEASAYEGGTFASVVANECFATETARRAIDVTNAIEEADEPFRLKDAE